MERVGEKYEWYALGFCLAVVYCILMFPPGSSVPSMALTHHVCSLPDIWLRNSSLIVCGYHIHHWIMFSVATIAMWISPVQSYLFYGIATVMTIQGLSYSDRFTIKRNDG